MTAGPPDREGDAAPQAGRAPKARRPLSLPEIMIVVTLIGALAFLAIPAYLFYTLRSQQAPHDGAGDPGNRAGAVAPDKPSPPRAVPPVVASVGRGPASLPPTATPDDWASDSYTRPRVQVVLSEQYGESAPERLPNRISWNYWIDAGEDMGLVPRPRLARLGLKQDRQLVFRLSTSDLADYFPDVKTLGGSPELLLAVRAAVADTARETLALDVLVQSVDPRRLTLSPGSERIPLEIDLSAMRRNLADPSHAMRPGLAPSEPQLGAALVAQFRIGLAIQLPGQHELGVVIVDRATGFPLQSMIVSIDSDETWPGNVSVRGNGRVLGSGGAPYELVLYLHDLGSSAYGKKSRSLHVQLYYRAPDSGSRELIAWRAELDLRGLLASASTFHKTVASIDSGEVLLEAARDFGRSLFDPIPADGDCAGDSNCMAAQRGRAAIVAAADYGSEQLPPSMLVRIVSSALTANDNFASPVFPIGALGVAGDETSDPIFLGERFALGLVLSDQQFESSNHCPERWYVALPRPEDHPTTDSTESRDPLAVALTGLAPLAAALAQSNHLHRQSPNLAELKKWIGDSGRGEDGAYVFAYLGHHDEGRLFLDQATPGVSVNSMRRRFGSSSIAILNACDSALSNVHSGTPVGRLAQQRVESTIATTSKVSGALAAAYLDCLNAVLQGQQAMTVGQAHARATQCLWSADQSARWGRHYAYRGSALKYILIGNAHQRICAPRQEKLL